MMEIALGLDNLIFISILTSDLTEADKKQVWRFWMIYSPLLRTILLVGLIEILKETHTLFYLGKEGFSLRDLILSGGGLFLLYKGVKEIHHRLEGEPDEESKRPVRMRSLRAILWQVALIDFVFSADSILTAIGMSRSLPVMLTALLLAVVIMLLTAPKIQRLIQRHPTLKILALAFLLLIGFALIGEGTGLHIPKGYLYFAMAFSLGVEMLNIRAGLRPQRS
ncbi:MAG: TerC family protein [Bacteroidia bacterium]|nr:TerC family protein [Bacteroidia bacterium]